MYHVLASKYGWTPDQVDAVDAETLDWMLAIQSVEREIEEQHRKSQEREMQRKSAAIKGRRRF